MFKTWLFKNDKEKKIFIIYIVSLTIIALILALLLIVIPRSQGISHPQQELPEEQGINYQTKTLILSDFIILDVWQDMFKPQYLLFRRRLKKWEQEQVAKYWIPPRTVGIEILTNLNDKNIRELLEGVP